METIKTLSGSDCWATYSPEDNKLRLYVGRVPRDEYEKLRAEGWTSTPKQSCDFVAVWTPGRRDTAMEYAGIIEDEDQGPEDRAADRAERFGDYRDKRTAEATGQADRYDAGPQAHGYQNQARAERSARRHDRIASLACDSWSKAEYWQRRTAGVISHALYKSRPDVRMGRIKTIESELRKHEKHLSDYAALYSDMQKIAAIADPEKQTAQALHYTGTRNIWAEYMHPRASEHPNTYRQTNKMSLYSLLSDEAMPITGAQAVELFFSNHREPKSDDDWTTHYKLRLAYENQMLEAQGGRAAFVEMVPGGKVGGKLILKVNKSSATGRVVSVLAKGPKIARDLHYRAKDDGQDYSLYQIETERLPENAYTAPTPESLAELETLKAERKAKTPAKAPCPLINPTDEEAEKLQAILNERAKADHCARFMKSYGNGYAGEYKPSTVCRITQKTYSAASKGSYGRAETRTLHTDAELGDRESNMYSRWAKERAERIGTAVCEVRTTENDGSTYAARRVIVLTDKPQKPLPAAVWAKTTPAAPKTANQVELIHA